MKQVTQEDHFEKSSGTRGLSPHAAPEGFNGRKPDVYKRQDREFQEKRKTEHLADPDKNKAAWQQKAQDASGRDWTKPRRPTLKDGEV